MKKLLQKTLDQAKAECELAGVRLTPKRLNVLSVMLARRSAVSAYQVIDDYQSQYGESLQAMSAYRILNFLVDAGLVHRLETTNQYIKCSHIACDHAHGVPQFLICSRCHGVTEVGLRKELVAELKASVEDTGFNLISQQLELYGTCKRCRDKKHSSA